MLSKQTQENRFTGKNGHKILRYWLDPCFHQKLVQPLVGVLGDVRCLDQYNNVLPSLKPSGRRLPRVKTSRLSRQKKATTQNAVPPTLLTARVRIPATSARMALATGPPRARWMWMFAGSFLSLGG
jgi:hypothetical protein